MSRVHKVESWADDDILVPDDVNRELEETVGEMNGHLDKDNVQSGELLTGAKFAVDSFNTIAWKGGLTSGSVTTADSYSDLERWIQLSSQDITTQDGRLSVIATYSYYTNSTTTGNEDRGAELGIRIDGTIVARSGTGGVKADCVATQCAAPVGPGAHTVEMVVRYGLEGQQFDHMGGGMFVRFVKR